MFETEIARGIALLDERRPGWETQIDLDRLNLGLTNYDPDNDNPEWNCGCLLAQTGRAFGFGMFEEDGVVGSYYQEARALGLAATEACGFSLGAASPGNYQTLTAEWRLAILTLRAERAVQEAIVA